MNRSVGLGALAGTVLLAGLQTEALRHQPDGALLQASEIRQAITYGLHSQPGPYPLFGRRYGVEQSSAVVGSVYTPRVRVAMWAYGRRTRLSMRPEPKDVPAVLLAPTAVIAIHTGPACCPQVDPGPALKACVALVPIGDGQVLPCEDRIGEAAEWVTADTGLLRQFDPEAAGRTAALAGFPLRKVLRIADVVYELHQRETSTGKVLHFVGYGTIRETDIATWR